VHRTFKVNEYLVNANTGMLINSDIVPLSQTASSRTAQCSMLSPNAILDIHTDMLIYIAIVGSISPSQTDSICIYYIFTQIRFLRSPLSIAKSPCTSRSLGEVASSSGGQQAREQKRSAGRQLGGGDDGFD